MTEEGLRITATGFLSVLSGVDAVLELGQRPRQRVANVEIDRAVVGALGGFSATYQGLRSRYSYWQMKFIAPIACGSAQMLWLSPQLIS